MSVHVANFLKLFTEVLVFYIFVHKIVNDQIADPNLHFILISFSRIRILC